MTDKKEIHQNYPTVKEVLNRRTFSEHFVVGDQAIDDTTYVMVNRNGG
ncbi:hypothetical protein ACFL3Q_16450 [Planctomycetota bacterium]